MTKHDEMLDQMAEALRAMVDGMTLAGGGEIGAPMHYEYDGDLDTATELLAAYDAHKADTRETAAVREVDRADGMPDVAVLGRDSGGAVIGHQMRDWLARGSGGVTFTAQIRAPSAEEARRIAEEEDLEWEAELDNPVGPDEIDEIEEVG